MQIDRQIAIWGGWIAGPAFGVAMMAAPEYLHLKPVLAALIFWGGIGVFILTVIVVFALSAREQERRHKTMWPIFAMALGVIIFGVGAMAFFWPASEKKITAPQPEDRWTWNALTDQEIDTLYGKLRGKEHYSIQVSCNRPECSELATSFDKLFKRLGWPSVIGDAGILAIGITGITILPSDQFSEALKDAIETTTVLRPEVKFPREANTPDLTNLIIGTKPSSMASGPALAVAAPSVALLPTDGQLRLYNRSQFELKLWGDKFGNEKTPLEKEALVVPVGLFYYFLTDRIETMASKLIGPNGNDLIPFEVYIEANGKHYTARFRLLIQMVSGKMTIHTQQFGVIEGGW